MSQEPAIAAKSKLSDKLAPAWIILSVAITTLLFLTAGIYTVRLPREQYERALWVGHTREVLEQLTRLALHVIEAESGQRGYLLTDDVDHLSPYNTALRQIADDLEHLQTLTADNAVQQDRLSPLREMIQAKLDEWGQTIALRKKRNDAAEVRVVASQGGEDEMTLIRRRIDEMRVEENELLQSRMAVWQNAASKTRFAVFSSGLVIFVLMNATAIAVLRLAREHHKVAEAERQVADIQRAETAKLMHIVSVQREVAGNSLDLEIAMQALTEHTGRLIRSEGTIVEMVEGDEMVYRAASGIAASYIGLRLNAEGSLSGQCVREGTVLRCDDSEIDERVDRAACRKVGLRSMVVVPLRHKDSRLGVLKVLSSRPHAFDDEDVATLELLASVLSGALSDAIGAETLRALNDELVAANANLARLATTDGLTELTNHRTFQETLMQEYQRAQRYKKPLSLLLLDVDHFKTFNDTYGHPAGDAVLKRVAILLRNQARATDHVARYGGEEFAVLLPETDARGADIIAQRIREAIAGDSWKLRQVTVSVGVSTMQPDCPSGAQLVSSADQALYQSKRDGRNRVSHYDPDAASHGSGKDSTFART